MGEAKRKNGFWPSETKGVAPPVRTSVDIIYPGDETRLLKLTGGKPERCRIVLGRALSDLVTGRSECAPCSKSFTSLDDLGCVVVPHIETYGKFVPL